MAKVYVDLSKVDWELLRKQKQTLLNTIDFASKSHAEIDAKDLRGLLRLLDNLQDQAAEILGEETVFGKDFISGDADSTN